MTRSARILAAFCGVATAAILSCSSNIETICSGTSYFPATTGTATFSGGLTGTANINTSASGGPGGFSFFMDSNRAPVLSVPVLQFYAQFQGNEFLPTGTFTNLGAANVSTLVQAEDTPGQAAPVWFQETLLDDDGGNVGPGSFRLTITSPGPVDAGPNYSQPGYYPHGTLFVDAPPLAKPNDAQYLPNPATKDVIVCASF